MVVVGLDVATVLPISCCRGLLGAHFVAETLKAKGHADLQWYDGHLVQKADQLGRKLLPAFNTTTGLPYPRVSKLDKINVVFDRVLFAYYCYTPHNMRHSYIPLKPYFRCACICDTCTAHRVLRMCEYDFSMT